MKRFLYFVVLSTLLFSGVVGPFKRAGSAVTASDWKAGSIIEDGIFTAASSMSTADIQSFLNSKVPACDSNGTKTSEFGGGTRAQWAIARGYPGAFTCLRDYYEVPKTEPGNYIPANNYGGKAIPAGAISAAQMIYNASQRYQINPKVLLVTIHKESSGPLTVDEWPLEKQYTYAMGAHCPDSGPGGSANCDVNYSGFSMQIAESAALMRWYLDSMSQSWWQYKKPYQNNYILWNVSQTGCGGGNVYIENKATAALYTYTPYQPNQAALNNMYGTGDGCSAYGNRNFWRIFNDWFGSGENYDWQIVDQAAYRDAARTERIGYMPSVQPGTTVYMQIKAKNIGSKPWNSMTRLVTLSPPGRSSIFYDPADWIMYNRPASPMEGTVPSGAVGTFNFTFKAPSQPRTAHERFGLIQDGVTLFKDIGQTFTVDITPIAPSSRAYARILVPGSILRPGEYMLSPDGSTSLTLWENGNLSLMTGFRQVWSTSTVGNPDSKLIMQGDGNLVLYNKDMRPLWSSQTNGTLANSLSLKSDGTMTLDSSTGNLIWATPSKTVQRQTEVVYPRLPYGGLLLPGQRLESADRTRMLYLQGDGNLVLYNKDMRPLWSSQTNGKVPKFLVMQADGNLVLYDTAMKPIWHTGTDGNGPSWLAIQDDSNLVIYRDDGRPTWATMTIER